MSESDDSDDDLLLSGPVFRKTVRQERAEDKSRKTGLAFLDSCLEDEKKRGALNESIARIKYEHIDDERVTQALTQANESKQKRKENPNEGLVALALRDELITAVDTVQTSILGTRRVLGKAHDKDVWSTVEFAMQDLHDIVKGLQSEKGGNKKEKAFQNDVVSLLKSAIQDKPSLERILMYRQLVKLCRKHNRMHLPTELTEWLLCMASSPIDEANAALSTGAFRTLVSIFSQAHGPSEKPLFTMKDMVRDMQAWFALNMDAAAYPSVVDEKETSVDMDTLLSVVNVKGLEQLLLLWEQVFANDIVAVDESSKETATLCIAALARASLDPCFYKCDGLLTTLQRVIHAVLAFVSRNIVSDPSEVKEWISSTVTSILDQCNKVGSSTDKSQDDDQVWLCLSLMVGSLSMYNDCTMVFGDIHRQFRATLAIQALQSCLEIDDWNKHMETVLSERGETELPVRASTLLAWRAIASSYAAFLTIPSLGNAFSKNGQKCLATTELIRYCLVTGITDHSGPIVDDEDVEDASSKGVFGSTDETRLLFRVMQVLEAESRQLASRFCVFSTDPNFSRAELILSCVRRYVDFLGMKARDVSGQTGSPMSVQKSIFDYFGSSQGSE